MLEVGQIATDPLLHVAVGRVPVYLFDFAMRPFTTLVLLVTGCSTATGDHDNADARTPVVDAALIDATNSADADSPIDAAPNTDATEGADAASTADAASQTDAVTNADAAPGSDAGGLAPGPLAYEKIDNIEVVDDQRRARWHPSGAFALLLGSGGKVARYDPAGGSVSMVTTLGNSVAAVDVAADGSYFLVLGTGSDSVARLWRVTVDGGMSLAASEEATLALGEARALARHPDGQVWAIGTSASTSISYLYLWEDGAGITDTNGYNASAGLRDLMWGDQALYAGSDNVILGQGVNGADSKTYVVDTDMVVGNAWPGGFGNPGGAGWRPGGSYGFFTAWTTNKLYVFDGAWQMATLPGVGTAASPNAVGWDKSGQRAVIVGRAIGPGLNATVIDYRPGAAASFDDAYLVEASIPDFDATPWFGNSNTHLQGVDWRPNSSCDEGVIVGSDNGSSTSPTFGLAIRFYDSTDPDC